MRYNLSKGVLIDIIDLKRAASDVIYDYQYNEALVDHKYLINLKNFCEKVLKQMEKYD